MKNKKLLLLSIIASQYTMMLYAIENITLESININGSNTQSSFIEHLSINDDMMASESFTKNAIETFSPQTNISALKVINMSASVNFNSADAFGSNESSFHDPIRIRGKNQSGPGGSLMIEGLPISSNPGGGKTIYDMENFSYIDLYKGYMPVNKSLGFSNLIGKVDLIIKEPSSKFAVTASQMAGSENTSRTFLRVDSGKMGDFTAFGSTSYTQGDKWKGDGDLQRTNAMFGLVYKPNSNFKAQTYLTINKDTHNNYYQMNYAQAKDLANNYNKDYADDATKGDYADYNKQEFKDISALAKIEYYFSNDAILAFKPYYLKDEGYYSFSTKPSVLSNTIIKKWDIDHDLYGGVLEFEKDITDSIYMKLGYWMHWQEPSGPPKEQKIYNVASGSPTFVKYGVLADVNRHKLNSPYLEFSGDISKFKYVLGVRYLTFELCKVDSYAKGTNASTSQEYNSAISNATLNSDASINSKKYTQMLPSAFLSYDINRHLNIYTSYTKSYNFDINLYSSYVSKASISSKATLQELWDKQQLELSDNYEIGLVYKSKNAIYSSNIYYTDISGKQVSAYDAEVDATYPTNNADAKSYGVELSTTGKINKKISYMLNGSFNKYYYTQDFKTSATTSTTIKSNQIPDAPKYMANASLTYQDKGFTITPILKYYSKRYGDVDNTQSIGSCTLVDIDASYKLKKFYKTKEALLKISITNLFDKEYISSIITPDNALASTTNVTTYQAGAPFAIYAGITLKF